MPVKQYSQHLNNTQSSAQSHFAESNFTESQNSPKCIYLKQDHPKFN